MITYHLILSLGTLICPVMNKPYEAHHSVNVEADTCGTEGEDTVFYNADLAVVCRVATAVISEMTEKKSQEPSI